MEGRQKAIYESINEILVKVSDGAYGEGDNIDEWAVNEDLEDICMVWKD